MAGRADRGGSAGKAPAPPVAAAPARPDRATPATTGPAPPGPIPGRATVCRSAYTRKIAQWSIPLPGSAWPNKHGHSPLVDFSPICRLPAWFYQLFFSHKKRCNSGQHTQEQQEYRISTARFMFRDNRVESCGEFRCERGE